VFLGCCREGYLPCLQLSLPYNTWHLLPLPPSTCHPAVMMCNPHSCSLYCCHLLLLGLLLPLQAHLLGGVGCTAQHSTAQHSTAQHSTAQHGTAQHSTAQHSTAQHSTAQHSTAQHSTAGEGGRTWHSTAPHELTRYSTVQRHATVGVWLAKPETAQHNMLSLLCHSVMASTTPPPPPPGLLPTTPTHLRPR